MAPVFASNRRGSIPFLCSAFQSVNRKNADRITSRQRKNPVEDPRICCSRSNRTLTSQCNRFPADSIIVKQDLFALLFEPDENYSLADLGRAIAYARRKDNVPVWRAFVRTRDRHPVREVKTQRIRVRYAREVVARNMGESLHALANRPVS